MIHEPPIDKLVEKVGNRFALCVLVAKRARQLIDQSLNQGLTEIPGKLKAISIASVEIMDDKLTYTND